MTLRAGSIQVALAGVALLAVAAGCDEGFCLDDCDREWLGPPPEEIPPSTSAENVIKAIQAIYNDKVRTAIDRSQLYARLLDPSFIFCFQVADVDSGLPELWHLEPELAAHSRMFVDQESGYVYSVELRVQHGPATDLIPSTPGGENWKQVFADNVYLRFMSNIDDGVEVNGGQAVFVFPPPVDGEWKIAAWMDMPSPNPEEGRAVERGTWGQIKYRYLPQPGPLAQQRSELHLSQP